MSKNVVARGILKSHAQRMAEAPVDYPKSVVADYEVRATEQVVVNGKVLKKSCVKVVHPQDKMCGLKAVDFALENVIAAGALDSLKEGYLSAGNASELADGMEGTIDNVINAVNEAEASDTQNDGGNE